MYTEEICSISKTDDDKFLVSIKQKSKPSKKDSPVCIENEMKVFVADSVEDVSGLLGKYLPKMKKSKDSEETYEEEFKKAG